MNTVKRRSEPVCLALEAMRCRFEIVLHGDDPVVLRAAGEEALREIQSLDRRLNIYSPSSELSRLNREAAHRPVEVSPPLFEALTLARDLAIRTRGAFDPALGPLVRIWREAIAAGRLPEPAPLRAAREATGTGHLRLDSTRRSAALDHPDAEINLNALAKGLALDEAAAVLREAGVGSALLHGGASSVLAIGAPPDYPAWQIGLADPERLDTVVDTVDLRDSALGLSSQSEQAVTVQGRKLGHVISPLSGEPIAGSHAAGVLARTAAVADALSTALLISEAGSVDWLLPGEQGLMLIPRSGVTRLETQGARRPRDAAK